MSTLTKVLVVLVSLISIFLCGIVVTYVANSGNYKSLYTQVQGERDDAEGERLRAVKQYNAQLESDKQVKGELNERIVILEEDKSNLAADLRTSQRESASYQDRTLTLQGVLAGLQQTNANMEGSLKVARDELGTLRADRTGEKKEFNQLQIHLYELIVQKQSLEADKDRLQEEMASLEASIEQLAGGKGVRRDARSNVVTREKSRVTRAGVGSAVALNGLITEVRESLVSISIGSADGVMKNMVFHVTRGDEFICDIVITDVDTNKAAGVVELKLQQPKTGDSISTKL